MTFEYDKVGDIMHIEKVPACPEQETEELDDWVLARYNPATGALEGLEILFFMRRLSQDKVVEVPADAFKMASVT